MTLELPELERRLGLHQDLTIIYVVDGYAASLQNESKTPRIIAEAHGETIALALQGIEEQLRNK